MNFLDDLKDNSILIIPNNIKSKVLDYIGSKNNLLNIKIMNFAEIKKSLFFDYNNETIYYVMKKYNVNYNVAKDYINSIYYLDKDSYDSSKLNELINLKKELIQNNLLIFDKLFINLIKSKSEIYVYGFSSINKFNKCILDKLNDVNKVTVINNENKVFNHEVLEFNTMNAEVSYVFDSICDLINKGISLDKIYIANYTEEYAFSFKTLSKSYNLPIYTRSNSNLYNTAIGTYFLNNISNNLDSLIGKIKHKFNSIEDTDIINKLSNLLNNYYWADNIIDLKDLIEAEMRLTKINNRHYDKEIITTNIIDNYFEDDEYVFLIGFNLGIIPKFKRDEDYIGDDIKTSLMETSNEYNKIIKDNYVNAINNIKNLTITYKLSSPFSTYTPSFLVSNYTIRKIDNYISKYSNSNNKLLLAKKIDNLIKFNEKDETLEILFNNYNIDYSAYDNKFTSINNDNLLKNIDNKLNFSYSNITDYYSCPFKFYINNILHINEYKSSLDTFIGHTFHHVLEKCLEDIDGDVSYYYDQYVNEHIDEELEEINEKSKFFIDILRKEITFVVETIRMQYQHSSHTSSLYEDKEEIPYKDKINTKIKGYVDKILIADNYMLIVDYKTNSFTMDKKLFEFGIGIQLPIYLYLLKCIRSNYEVAGIYIQHILDLDNKYYPNKDIIDERRKKLKLVGITFDDMNALSKFDDSYEKSEVIGSLSIKKSGEFSARSNIMSLKERDELADLMESLIYKCIKNVQDGKFDIYPLKIEKEHDACRYCSYKDICYRKFKDFNIQEIKKEDDDNE
jgi:hypothetical protein